MTQRQSQKSAQVKKLSNETLASSVYSTLKGDIITGKLKPGHKLRLQILKEVYNVGNSPLREALNRLSANGMVTREENKGFKVSTASVEELQELVKTRCWLEEIALRESIKNGDDQYDERIVLAVHRLSRPNVSSGDNYSSPKHQDLHREFHESILAACNSGMLLRYCSQIRDQSFRYRNLTEVVRYRAGHEEQEHQDIRDAILERNADKAVKLLCSHYQITADILIESGILSQDQT